MSSSLVPGDERTPGTSRAAGAHLSSASSLGALYDSYALQQRDSRSRSSSCASSTTTSRASSRSRGAAAGEETERSATTTARQEGQQKGLHRRSSSRLKREHEHDESVAYLDTATMERSLSATSSANELLDDDEYAGLRRAAVPPAGAPLYPSTTDSPPSSPPRRRRPQQQRQRLHVSTPSVSPALARKNTLDALRRVSVRVVNLSGSHAAAAAAAGGDTDDENEARERPPTSARPPASPIRAAEDGPRSPLPLSEAEQAKARAMRAEELAKLEREQWRVLRGKSLGFFGPQSRLRRACADALAWSGTQPVILLAIVLETVVLAIQASKDVFTNPRPAEGYFHDWEDYVLFVIFALFTLEIAARIIATGLIRNTAPTTASPPPPPAYAPCDTYASFATHATRDTYDTYPPYSSTDALTDEKRRPPQRSQTTDSAWTTFERPSLGAQKINLRPPGASEGETGPQAPFALAIRQQQAAAVSAFLRHSWNRLDLVAVVAFWLSFALAMTGAEQRYNLYFFRAVSVVRTARLLAFTEGTATILHSLKVAAPQLANVAFFVVFAMVLFSIVGVQSFARSFTRACVYVGGDGGNVTMQDQRCGGFVNASSGERVGYIESQTGLPLADGPKGFICPVDSVCVEVGNPANGRFSFDNVLAAMQQVVIVTSANGWTDIMFAMQDADFAASCLFFIVCIVVLNFWLVNLFVAAITTSFEAIMDETGRSSFASTRLRDAAARAIVRPAAAETHLRRGASFLRKWYYRTQLVWVACVVVDVALLATRSYDMSQDWADLLVRAELAFTLVFDLEMVVRFVAYLPDWRGFVLQSSNVADLLLALATTIIQIPAIRNSLVYPWLTAFQIARFYRVIVAIPRMRKLLTRILGTLSGLINMIAFLLLITLIAALIAVQFLRGEVEQGDEMTFYQTFNAFLAMYQVRGSPACAVLVADDNVAGLFVRGLVGRARERHLVRARHVPGHPRRLFSLWLDALLLLFVRGSCRCRGARADTSSTAVILFQMFIALINENFRIAEENKRLEQQQAYDRRHEPSNAIPGWYRRINPYTYLRRPDDDERKSGARFGQQLVQKAQRLFSARDPARDDGDVHKEAQERSLAILHERRASQLDFVVAHPSYDKSLWLFAQGNPVRRFCQRLVDPSSGDTRYGGRPAVRKERRAFKVLVFAAIIASVVVAAMATPLYRKAYFEQRASTRRSWFTYTEVSLGTVFLVEFVVKVIADGFLFTPNAYLLSTWNCVDFFVLLTLLVNVVTTLVDPLGVNRFTRALKAFRPLRLINLWAPLREAFFNVIIVGAGRIVDASILAILYIIPYAIWGLNIFAGLLFSCNDDAVASKNECVGEFATTVVGDGDAWTFTIPRVWTNPTVWSFDTFRQSLLILFEIISLEGWIDVMTSTLGIRGRDLQPEHDAAQWNALFFIAYNLAGGAFILALFVSVIIEGFTRQSGMSLLTLEQRQWVDLRKLIKRQRPAKRPKRRPTDALRSWCFDRATQKTGWYSKVMTSLYIIHVCVLMVRRSLLLPVALLLMMLCRRKPRQTPHSPTPSEVGVPHRDAQRRCADAHDRLHFLGADAAVRRRRRHPARRSRLDVHGQLVERLRRGCRRRHVCHHDCAPRRVDHVRGRAAAKALCRPDRVQARPKEQQPQPALQARDRKPADDPQHLQPLVRALSRVCDPLHGGLWPNALGPKRRAHGQLLDVRQGAHHALARKHGRGLERLHARLHGRVALVRHVVQLSLFRLRLDGVGARALYRLERPLDVPDGQPDPRCRRRQL